MSADTTIDPTIPLDPEIDPKLPDGHGEGNGAPTEEVETSGTDGQGEGNTPPR